MPQARGRESRVKEGCQWHAFLIVDDDTDLLEGQKVYLEKKGYTVQTALSIDEGLACARETAPDLVIADLMMEHYDSGFVFCKKVRDLPGLEKVPILMQTAAPRKMGFCLRNRRISRA